MEPWSSTRGNGENRGLGPKRRAVFDEKLVAQLPVFFRTLSGQKPSREDLEKLLEIINRIRQP